MCTLLLFHSSVVCGLHRLLSHQLETCGQISKCQLKQGQRPAGGSYTIAIIGYLLKLHTSVIGFLKLQYYYYNAELIANLIYPSDHFNIDPIIIYRSQFLQTPFFLRTLNLIISMEFLNLTASKCDLQKLTLSLHANIPNSSCTMLCFIVSLMAIL